MEEQKQIKEANLSDIEDLELKLEGKLPVTKDDLIILVNTWGRSIDTVLFFKKSNVTFSKCEPKEKLNLSKLDISKIDSLSCLFRNSYFNGDISLWDVSNVTGITSFMANNLCFDHPLDKWNFTKLVYAFSPFDNAKAFQDKYNDGKAILKEETESSNTNSEKAKESFLNWLVDHKAMVKEMSKKTINETSKKKDFDLEAKDIIDLDKKLNGELPITRKELLALVNSWGREHPFNVYVLKEDGINRYYDIKKCESKEKFDLSKLDISRINDLSHVFQYSFFNGDINNWNISNVKNACNVFYSAKVFDFPLDKWVFSKDIEDLTFCFPFADAFKKRYNNSEELPTTTNDFLEWFNININKTQKTYSYDLNSKEDLKKVSDKFKILKLTPTKITFDNIVGMKSVKSKLKDILAIYKEDLDKLTKYGITRDKGFILYGKPGTGKTMLCQAFAKELDAAFVYISMETLINTRRGDITMANFINELRDISTLLYDKNIVIFLDEMDSLRARGTSANNDSYFDGLTNDFLYTLDRLPTNIIIVGATNHINKIDHAVLRAGRLGNKYHVNSDFTKNDIKGFVYHEFTKVGMEAITKYANDIALLTYHLTGSEVANAFNKIKQAYYFRKSDENLRELVIQAIHKAKYNITAELVENDNLKETAYHEAGHAIATLYCKNKVVEVSIYPGRDDNSLGHMKNDPKTLSSKKAMENYIVSMLAGRYGAKLFTKEVSYGESSDLEKAYLFITGMVASMGMAEKGPLKNYATIQKGEAYNLLGGEVASKSEYIRELIDKECLDILERLSNKTERIIELNKHVVEEMANDLLKEKVLIDCFEKYEKMIVREDECF